MVETNVCTPWRTSFTPLMPSWRVPFFMRVWIYSLFLDAPRFSMVVYIMTQINDSRHYHLEVKGRKSRETWLLSRRSGSSIAIGSIRGLDADDPLTHLTK